MMRHENSTASAEKPRPQTEAERINNRLAELVDTLYNLRRRIDTVADHIVGAAPATPTPGLEQISANTQHFIVDLERAIEGCSSALSRLDNQGT